MSEVKSDKIEEIVSSPVEEVQDEQEPVQGLAVPIVLNTPDAEWLDEPSMFYNLASNGLFKCRNNRFFTSCVRTSNFPSELEEQRQYLKIKYPKISKKMFEKVVGFFSNIYDLYKSESIVLLYWNTEKNCYYLSIPEQFIEESVWSSWEDDKDDDEGFFKGFLSRKERKKRKKAKKEQSHSSFSLDVKYKFPVPQPQLLLVASIHCHANISAFSSSTDERDEKHFAGIHIVVGNITQEPPSINIEAVADGVRFSVKREMILEGYEKRDCKMPQTWIDQMKVVKKEYKGYRYSKDDNSNDLDTDKSWYRHTTGYRNYQGSGYTSYNSDSGYSYGSGFGSGSSYKYEKLEAELDEDGE